MTTDAVGEVSPHLFLMLLGDLTLVVLVTSVACVCRIAVGMAGGTSAACPAMVHGEGMRAIVRGRSPSTRGMAGSTIQPEKSSMEGRLLMAVKAGCGRSHIRTSHVTLEAGCRDVRAGERKTGKIVVEGHLRPSIRRVACAAILPKLTRMVIIFSMAGNTLSGRVDELTKLVAPIAGGIDVGAGELETGSNVIINMIDPLRRLMAGATILSELTHVDIIFGVTCGTHFRYPNPLPVNMA
jgi:hypothetical protein